MEEAIRVHQHNDVAVMYGLAASSILEKLLLGRSMKDTVSTLDREAKEKYKKGALFDDIEVLKFHCAIHADFS